MYRYIDIDGTSLELYISIDGSPRVRSREEASLEKRGCYVVKVPFRQVVFIYSNELGVRGEGRR
jgi:hypothetical protein